MEQNKEIEILSRTAAVTFVLARAFNLWNKRLEAQARKFRQVHTHETKHALGQIADGCKKASLGLSHFEDWALDAGVTESGHSQDGVALQSYLTDGAWLAYLAGATFNAGQYNDGVRLQIESLCKVTTKGEPLIPWDVLADMRPVV